MTKSFDLCSPFSSNRYIDYKNSYIYFTFKIKTKKTLIKEEFESDLFLNKLNGLYVEGNKLLYPEGCEPTLSGVQINNFEYNYLNKNTPNKRTTQTLPVLQFNNVFFENADKFFDNGTNLNYLHFKETMYSDDKNSIWIILRCKIDENGFPEIQFLKNCPNLSSRFLKFEFETGNIECNVFKNWFIEFPEFHILSEKENCDLPIDFLYDNEDVVERKINITKQFSPLFQDFYTIRTINKTKDYGSVIPSKEIIEYPEGSNATYLFSPYKSNEINHLIVDNVFRNRDEKVVYFENITKNHIIDVSFCSTGLEKVRVKTIISNLSTGMGTVTDTTFVGIGETFMCEIRPRTDSYIHCIKVHRKQDDGTYLSEIVNDEIFNNVLNIVILQETEIEVIFLSKLQDILTGKDLVIEFHYDYNIFDISLNDGEYEMKHNDPPLLIRNYTNPILKMEITRNGNRLSPYFSGFDNTIFMVHRKMTNPVFINGLDILVGYNAHLKETGFTWCYNLDTTKTEGGYKLEFGQSHRTDLDVSSVCPFMPDISLPEIPDCIV